MGTRQDARAEPHREYVRSMDRIHRGVWILLGLLAMLGGTLVRCADLREAIAAWLSALFFVALGGYCLALGTAGCEAFRRGPRQRTAVSARKRRAS